jgi:hypothetical protein
MSFIWVSTPPGAHELRAAIERGAIALLSNYDRDPIDPPTAGWLGRHSSRELVWASGLWNNEFVRDPWDPSFFARFERSALDTVAVPSKVIY